MKRLFNIVILSIIILLLLAPRSNVIAGKKGVAGPGGCPQTLDLPFLYNVLDVDWAYTWATCLWPMPSIEYVPMVRSIHTSFNIEKARQALLFYGSGGYWLVGNEPDNQWQDNLTPMEAAISYGEIVNTILEADPTARIILGNFSNPSLYFRNTWFSQFKSAWIARWNEDVTTRIVGWGVHAYVKPYPTETYQNAIDRVQRQILAWKDANADCQLWITEFGNIERINGPTEFGTETETNIEIMQQMTIWLDVNVDRYAMFYFGDEAGDWNFTSLYTEPWPLPMLTELGEVYINLPIRTPTLIPTLAPRPSATPSIIPSVTSSLTITPTVIITPTLNTVTPSPTISPIPTEILLPTPPVNPNMPNTTLGVAQEQLRVTWRLERLLYAISIVITGGITWLIKSSKGEKNSG